MVIDFNAIRFILLVVIIAIIICCSCLCNNKKNKLSDHVDEYCDVPCPRYIFQPVIPSSPASVVISTPPPICPTAIMEDDICMTGNISDLPGQTDFDITILQLPSTPLIDWSTLQFTTIDVYSHMSLNGDATNLYANCRDPSNVPYGTHDPNGFSVNFDACGPLTEQAPGTFTYDGCSNVNGVIDAPNGESYSYVWSHDNAGTFILNGTGTETFPPIFTYWRINYTVEDVDGCIYSHQLYFEQNVDL
jgi:hypothetical protein